MRIFKHNLYADKEKHAGILSHHGVPFGHISSAFDEVQHTNLPKRRVLNL